MEATTKVSEEQRHAALAAQIATLSKKGWRVESQTDLQAAMTKGKRPNHILHLLLTIVTAGLWGIFVWLPLCIFKHEKRTVFAVNEAGEVHGA